MAISLHVAPLVAQGSGSESSGGLLSNPWFYAAFSAVSLSVGSAVGIWLDPEQKWQAILLAVGGGSLLTGQVHGALAFLFALVVTNGSQSMMSGHNVKQNHGSLVTLGAWVAIGVVIGASVVLGYWILPSLSNYWLGAIRAFAGGAILSSLAGEIYPDAYEQVGPYVTLATAFGFLGTFLP